MISPSTKTRPPQAQELSAAFPAAHHLPSYRLIHPPLDDDRKQGLPCAQATSLDDQPLARDDQYFLHREG